MGGCIGQQKTNLNKNNRCFSTPHEIFKKNEWNARVVGWNLLSVVFLFVESVVCFDFLFLKKAFLLETNVVDLLGNSHNRVTS